MAATCPSCGGPIRAGTRFCPSCGTAQPAAPGMDATRSTTNRTAVAVAATALLLSVTALTAVVAVALTRDGSPSSRTVTLIAANDPGPAPFTESVSTLDIDTTTLTAPPTSGSDHDGVGRATTLAARTVTARDRSLYLRGTTSPCSQGRLIKILTADPDLARTWADTMGIDVDDISTYVTTLAAVTLATDVAVTNHTYSTSNAHPFQAILQAGTNVLVDAYGTPRVQCSCGNPLLEPTIGTDPTIDGTPWPDFDPELIDHIEPTPEPLPEIPTTDPDTGEDNPTPVGDTIETLDGYLLSTFNSLPAVLPFDGGDAVPIPGIDEPVEKIVDDGAGGLVFTYSSSSERKPSSMTDEQAGVWHLPAGAVAPQVLVSAAEVRAGTGSASARPSLSGVSLAGGRRIVFYTEPRRGLDAAASSAMTTLDLDTGAKTTIEEGGSAEEHGIASLSSNGTSTLLGGWSMPGPYVVVLDEHLTEVDTDWDPQILCTATSTESCSGSMALTEDGAIVVVQRDSGSIRGVRLVDATTGALQSDIDAPMTSDAYVSVAVDRDGRALLSTLSAVAPAKRIDLASGAVSELPGTEGRIVTPLQAPLVRTRVGTPPVEPAPPTPAPNAITVDQLRNATLPPEVCDGLIDHEGPRQLVDGMFSSGEYGGGVNISRPWSGEGGEGVVVGDLDGDGVDDGAIALTCFSGGSGTALGFHVFTAANGYLGPVDFDLVDNEDGMWEHIYESIAIRDGSLHLGWAIDIDGDCHACEKRRHATGQFAVRDGQIVNLAVDYYDDPK